MSYCGYSWQIVGHSNSGGHPSTEPVLSEAEGLRAPGRPYASQLVRLETLPSLIAS